MIAYPTSLKGIGGAHSGSAPVNLLDVQDVNGNQYYWSERPASAPSASALGTNLTVTVPSTAMPWQYGASFNSAFSWGLNDGTAPVVIPLNGASSVTITASGLVYFDSTDHTGETPAGISPNDPHELPSEFAGYPHATAIFMGVAGAFCDAAGNVISVVFLGTSATVAVPAGASQLQLGINDWKFADNTGSFDVQVQFTGATTEYSPWLLSVPELTFHRSAVTDVGNFVLQNLSGDTVSRDFEKIMRKSALEGSFFVYRCWQPEAAAAWIEVHGKFTVDDVGVDTVTLKSSPGINPAEDDTPAEQYCETCQWRWSSAQCGASGSTECQYSYQTCQVPERILVVLNDYEKNYGEAAANTPTQVINRRRRI